MNRPSRLFTAIDIGSHKLKMKIVETNSEGEVRILETADLLIPLGRDTFNDGKLSFESVKKTCEAIQGFKRLMTDYGVKEWRIVATSAIREASNRDFMIDRIRLLTGFDAEIINNSQEKFLIYKAIKWQLNNSETIKTQEPTLILNIGAGSIQLLLTENNLLVSSQSLKIGALRIKESISKLEKHTLNFTRVLEEYIEAHIESVEYLKSSNEITNFVLVSAEFEQLLTVLGLVVPQRVMALDKARFNEIYEKILTMTTQSIAESYGLSLAEAELFVPALILIRKFFEKTSHKKIIIPNVSLVDGMIVERVNMNERKESKIDFSQDILFYVRNLAERYKYNKKHSEFVEETSLIIFDQMASIHGLDKKARFLLQIAALLHDTGKYIGADPHYIYSYNIIKAAQVIGLSDEDLLIVASVARYHSQEAPSFESSGITKLATGDKITAMKLIAIIRIADALDTSHKQKLKLLSLGAKEGRFVIKAEVSEEVILETWTFQMKAEFFTEVFGMEPILQIKNRLLG